MIVPPNTWSESDRKGFIEWSASVGFGVRNAGGGVTFLVLRGERVEAVHVTLERAWKISKERKQGGGGGREKVRRIELRGNELIGMYVKPF